LGKKMRIRVVPGGTWADPVRSGIAACKNPEFRKLYLIKGGGGGKTEFVCGMNAASHGVVPAVAAGAVVQLTVPITVPVPGSVQSVVITNVHGTGGLGMGGPGAGTRTGGSE
jgi:hypothetical protein